MLKNYLKIAFRSIWKDKFFSLLNISGLAIGIACCLLIMTYVNYEVSFDKHFDKHENIHRLVISGAFNGQEFTGVQMPSPAGQTFVDEVPEVVDKVRFRNAGSWVVKYEDLTFNGGDAVFADERFFRVFSVNVLQGNPDEALLRKNTVALSRSTAKKYFGDEDPLGKVLEFDVDENFEVTAIYEDIPDNTHFHFEMVMSFITREDDYNDQAWLNQNYQTYLVLTPGADFDQVNNKINEIAVDRMSLELKQYLDMSFEDFQAAGNDMKYFMQPLGEVHLESDSYGGGFEAEGDMTYFYIFTAIAGFILVIACINFMNLATARSANRAKEVGLRKVMGFLRHQIVNQFISESVLITLISGLIGLSLAVLVLPFFNDFADRQMSISFIDNLPIVAGGSFIVGFLAGLYPAFFLSAFTPAKVLKGNLSLGMKSGGLRKVLVTFQFFISILLIIATFSILNQLQYIQNKKLGFDKERVLVLHNAFMLNDNREPMKNAVLQNPDVSNVTYSGFLPTSSNRSSTVFFPDAIIDQDRGQVMQNWRVDYDYLETFGMNMKKGRFFSEDFGSDSTAIIINESAAKFFGIEEVEGRVIGMFDNSPENLSRYNVIGIVEDFHFESLKDRIAPLAMRLGTNTSFLNIKLNTDDYQAVISDMENKWNEFAPGQPFEYTFLDDRFTNMYEIESKLGDIFLVFAALAIVIACLGLFGLAAFTAEQKTKEVGIRKVLGASLRQLLYLMSKEITALIIISFVLASALGYWGVNWWMQDFEYHPDANPLVFVMAGLGAFAVAMLTMSYQSIKVAIANPVKALRNE